ncbi:MAG: WbqC family protein [Prevotella sp.]|nr:WbqC family protein [Prevotella sp.]
MKTLLSTTYCGPVQWYQKLYRSEEVFMERQETFQKQTYRNRCVIATTNGLQTLTVPVERSSSNLIKDIRISNHGNWRHQHWFALMSAYNESPFFDYYQDDFRPFYERQYDFLYDFNMEICHKVCELIDIQPNIKETSFYRSVGVRPLPPPSPCRGSLTSNPSSLISHLSSKIGSSPHSTNLSTRQLVN